MNASQRALVVRAAEGLLGGSQGLKERELQGHLRIYGIEGEAGREGEGRTRITESSRRRPVIWEKRACKITVLRNFSQTPNPPRNSFLIFAVKKSRRYLDFRSLDSRKDLGNYLSKQLRIRHFLAAYTYFHFDIFLTEGQFHSRAIFIFYIIDPLCFF